MEDWNVSLVRNTVWIDKTYKILGSMIKARYSTLVHVGALVPVGLGHICHWCESMLQAFGVNLRLLVVANLYLSGPKKQVILIKAF